MKDSANTNSDVPTTTTTTTTTTTSTTISTNRVDVRSAEQEIDKESAEMEEGYEYLGEKKETPGQPKETAIRISAKDEWIVVEEDDGFV